MVVPGAFEAELVAEQALALKAQALEEGDGGGVARHDQGLDAVEAVVFLHEGISETDGLVGVAAAPVGHVDFVADLAAAVEGLADIAVADRADDLHGVVFREDEEADQLALLEGVGFVVHAALVKGQGAHLGGRKGFVPAEVEEVALVEGLDQGGVAPLQDFENQPVRLVFFLNRCHGFL